MEALANYALGFDKNVGESAQAKLVLALRRDITGSIRLHLAEFP